MRPHRPRPTDHGMHCTCGVFCGRGVESWRAHRDDLLVLYSGADTIEREHTARTQLIESMNQIGEAYARVFENGGRAMKAFADALAADLRRGNEARSRRLRAEQLAFLNRPVMTPPIVVPKLDIPSQSEGH